MNQTIWEPYNSDPRTVWIDHLEDGDLPAIIRNAFCIAQPSAAEGYGYPPLEAMACGVPAVVSSLAVLTETTGGNALTADPAKPEAWLESLKALENAELHQILVKKSLKWVEPFRGQKGWEKHIADIEELMSAN